MRKLIILPERPGVLWQRCAWSAFLRRLWGLKAKHIWSAARRSVVLLCTDLDEPSVASRMEFELCLDPTLSGPKAILLRETQVSITPALSGEELDSLNQRQPSSIWSAVTSDGRRVPVVDFGTHNSTSPMWAAFQEQDLVNSFQVRAGDEPQVVWLP